MKRCLTFLLAACILCGVLVGCSSAPDTSQQSSSSSDISSNVTDDSESTDSSATELPDGPVKDAINTASQTLLNGTASGKLMEEGESIAVWVETQSSGYANKEELSSNFVEFIEEFCSNCETDFPYTGVGFSLFVDDDIVAMVTPLFKEGKFILQSDPLIVNDEYSQIKSLVSNSAYFSGASEEYSFDGFKEIFNDNTTGEIVNNYAIIHIPVDPATAENIYPLLDVFYDTDSMTDLFVQMEMTRIFERDVDNFTFQFCTTSGEWVLEYYYNSAGDEMFNYDTGVDYNQAFESEILKLYEMINQDY